MRPDVAGIDLRSERHWVCARAIDGAGGEIADFGATTTELIRMGKWLKARAPCFQAPGAYKGKGRRLPMWVDLQRDFLLSLRRFRETPGFSLAAVFILALGIGATSSMFSVVDAFLLRPLPFARPAELMRIYEDDQEGAPGTNSFPAFLDIAGLTDVFAAAAAIIGQQTSWMPDGSWQGPYSSW